jgi:transposase
LVDTSKTEENVHMGQHSKEFRDNAVRLCESRGWRVAEVARELKVKYQTLYGWVAKARGMGVPKQERDGETAEEELKRLRRENRFLTEEVEIAKKAAAFFARHQR